MDTGEFIAGGNPAMDQHSFWGGGIDMLLGASSYGNKLQPDEQLGLYAEFIYLFYHSELQPELLNLSNM